MIMVSLVLGEDSVFKWESVEAKKIGYRRGSYTFYRKKRNEYYIYGGGKNDKWTKASGIAASATYITVNADTYEVKSFKPFEKFPKNKKGKSFFPGKDGRVYVPKEDIVYCINKNNPNHFLIYKYDIGKRSIELINKKMPKVAYNGSVLAEYGFSVALMSGFGVTYDSHNKELIFMGGHTSNAPNGFVGHWAFDVIKKTWRQFKSTDVFLAELRTLNLDLLVKLRKVQGYLSNEHFNAKASKDEALVAKLLADVKKLAESLVAKGSTYTGKHQLAAQFSLTKLKPAKDLFSKIQTAYLTKSFQPKNLRELYALDKVFDETADLFLEFPAERKSAGISYNEKHKKILYFGGDHGNFLFNDTWLYDCQTKTWSRLFLKTSPKASMTSGRFMHNIKGDYSILLGGVKYSKNFTYYGRKTSSIKDVWKFDFSKNSWVKILGGKGLKYSSIPLCLNTKNELFGTTVSGKFRKIKVSAWKGMLDINQNIPIVKPVGPDSRMYYSAIKEYDPQWYIEDAKPQKEKLASWLSALPKNTWIDVPKASKRCPQRDWGTGVFDPVRDQFYHWTGGHMADCSDIVSTYHVGTNSWSIPYVASYGGKGISFEGRPDCRNHTYLTYAYDEISKKIIMSATGGMFIYDPDTRQFEKPIKSSHYHWPYYTKLKSTPYGVLGWVSQRKRLFALFNAKKKVWERLPIRKGSPFPRASHGDEAALEYDSKRDCMWFFTANGYRKFTGDVFKYDFKAKTMVSVPVKNKKSVGVKFRTLRETVYAPKQDIVMHNGFMKKEGKLCQIVFDPEKASWALLPISIKSKNAKKDFGWVSIGLMYDAKRNLIWAISGKQYMYVFKPDFKKSDLIYQFETKKKQSSEMNLLKNLILLRKKEN